MPVEAVAAWSFPVVYAGYTVETSDDLARGAQAMIDDTASDVFGTDRPSWFQATVREGDDAEVLIEESKGAQMLVVGSRGHGGFAGLLLGSVSEACAERAACPVLVFHDAETSTAA